MSIRTIGPTDEYSSYAPAVVALLPGDESGRAVASYLARFEQEEMGLPLASASRRGAVAVSARSAALPLAAGQNPVRDGVDGLSS